jgi:ATP-dependent DNA ligase
MITPITFPARPRNGGPFPKALPKSGHWWYEPKYNGWRAWVHVPSGTMFNRQNEPLTIGDEFAPVLAKLRCRSFIPEWLDCEALERRHNIGRGSLLVLDSPSLPGNLETRRCCLQLAFEPWKDLNLPLPANTAWLTMSYREDGARGLWDLLKQCNAALGCDFYEGVVAKRVDSLYPVQLRSPDSEFGYWVKHRWSW